MPFEKRIMQSPCICFQISPPELNSIANISQAASSPPAYADPAASFHQNVKIIFQQIHANPANKRPGRVLLATDATQFPDIPHKSKKLALPSRPLRRLAATYARLAPYSQFWGIAGIIHAKADSL